MRDAHVAASRDEPTTLRLAALRRQSRCEVAGAVVSHPRERRSPSWQPNRPSERRRADESDRSSRVVRDALLAETGAPAGVLATDQLHMQSRSRRTDAAAESAVAGSLIRAIASSPKTSSAPVRVDAQERSRGPMAGSRRREEVHRWVTTSGFTRESEHAVAEVVSPTGRSAVAVGCWLRQRCLAAPGPEAESREVKAVEAVGLAADPPGEEVAAAWVAKDDKWSGVAGEIESETAVGEVASWAGEPLGGGEPPLVGRVIESRKARRSFAEKGVKHRGGVGIVCSPADGGEIKRLACPPDPIEQGKPRNVLTFRWIPIGARSFRMIWACCWQVG